MIYKAPKSQKESGRIAHSKRAIMCSWFVCEMALYKCDLIDLSCLCCRVGGRRWLRSAVQEWVFYRVKRRRWRCRRQVTQSTSSNTPTGRQVIQRDQWHQRSRRHGRHRGKHDSAANTVRATPGHIVGATTTVGGNLTVTAATLALLPTE